MYEPGTDIPMIHRWYTVTYTTNILFMFSDIYIYYLLLFMFDVYLHYLPFYLCLMFIYIYYLLFFYLCLIFIYIYYLHFIYVWCYIVMFSVFTYTIDLKASLTYDYLILELCDWQFYFLLHLYIPRLFYYI